MMTSASLLEVIQSLVIQLAAFQAVLLLVSGLHKLVRRDRLRTAVHEFAGVPRNAAPLAVGAVAAAELLASLLLWMPSCRAVGGMMAVLIWGGYLALIVRAIALGRRDVDCGCTFGVARRPLGAFQVARNVALTGAAIVVAAGSAAGAGQITASQILAASVLLVLYGALDQAMALTPPRSGELI
jgi:hypothetical protein